MGDLANEIFKAIVFFIVAAAVGVAVVAGGGAIAGYMAASALGAGKAVAITSAVAGGIAVPTAVIGGWSKLKSWKKERERKKWRSNIPSFSQAAAPAPSPAPAPTVKPAAPAPADDGTPPVFVDALTKMKEMDPEERKKYLDRLRDAFPNEVETLHKYDDDMALAHQTPTMKKITLKQPGA